jgi:ribosomal protein L44E
MAKEKRVRQFCEQCQKNTVHEILNTGGQESSACLACRKRAIELEKAEIADQNRCIAQKIQADRDSARDASFRLGIRNGPFF